MDQATAPRESIHKVLAHSYATYFGFFLTGVCLDILFNMKVFTGSSVDELGFIFIILGTSLILWAQRASRSLKKENITRETFTQGPYKYTRNPTHWGLFLLMLGFGMVINAFFVIILSFINFIFTKITFLNKEERLLAEKYGEPYLAYKHSVKL